MLFTRLWRLSRLVQGVVATTFITSIFSVPALAQQRRPAPTTRAESLYVSADPADHSTRDWAQDIKNREGIDSIYAARSAGVMDFKKVTYRSPVGDMDIPAFLFQPLAKRGAKGHAAMKIGRASCRERV